MDILLIPLINVLMIALNLYWWAVFIYVLLEWLERFNIVNKYNQFIYSVHTFLFRIVEPALAYIRRFLPAVGQIDMAPMALILLIIFLQGVVSRLTLKFI